MTTHRLLLERHAAELRAERARRRESQAELGAALGVTGQAVGHWEAGKVVIPDRHRIAIAARYGRNPNEMFSLVAGLDCAFPGDAEPINGNQEDQKCKEARPAVAADRDGTTEGTDALGNSGTDAAASATVQQAAVAS